MPPFSPGSSITDSGDWTHKNDDDEEEEEIAVSWIFWGAAAFASLSLSLSRRAAASGVKGG